ncbi:hypothetical protein ANN_17201 [Periplaneta americana]|uniref:Uncharacterized protein n=1 Tax=Periplaneta americana TaxID=6978 RepID=A0ABQ8SS95_PERAM|nr:hypothetical protein ANN_17201 [Periplaneta americana]
MAGLCEGGNEPPGSLKASKKPQCKSTNTEVSDLKKSVEFISNKFDVFNEELKSAKEEIRNLTKENELLKQEIGELQQSVDIEEKIGLCLVEFPGSSVGTALTIRLQSHVWGKPRKKPINKTKRGIQPKPERSYGSAGQRVCRLSYIDGSTKNI